MATTDVKQPLFLDTNVFKYATPVNTVYIPMLNQSDYR